MIELQAKPLPVRQQGDRRACVGFATAAAHELASNSFELLSPEDALWAAHQLMGHATGDDTSVELALFGLSAEEEATEAAWPYGEPHWSAGRPEAARQSSNRRTLPAWHRFDTLSIAAIREGLQSGSAVVLTVEVVKPVWIAPPDSVIDAPPGLVVRGNHAVTVIGAAEESEKFQALRIRNSWGEKWADQGYAWISERYLRSYGICAHAIGGHSP